MLRLKIINNPKPLRLRTQVNFPNVILGKMQEKTVKPKTTSQEVLPDKNYDGLSKVNVEAVTNEIDTNIKSENIKKDISILGVQGNVEELKGTKLEVTKNGTYTPEEPYNAFTEVETNVEVDVSEYFTASYMYGGIVKSLKALPLLPLPKDCYDLFQGCSSLTTIPALDTSNVTNMAGMFTGCTNLTSIPQLDTSNVTSFSECFSSCTNLTSIPQLDMSNATSLYHTFYNCSKLTSIVLLNTNKISNMVYTFALCSSLITIPALDTSNVTNMELAFYNCSKLTNIPLLNMQKVNNIRITFSNCSGLIDLGGFQNLGQAFETTKAANYPQYSLYLETSKNLTHDSLMNIINNLYDIATKGVKTQKLTIGSTNIAKLTADEIAIATNKGWSVS